MHIVLFIFYGIVLCYAITRMNFFRNSGIRPTALLLLFGLRVATGCLHNLIAWRYFPNHGDIWNYFQLSFLTRHELFTDFHQFVADNSTWAYLPYNCIMVMHLLFNFFSFDNLYINTLFFSFAVFGGSVAMFRAFRGFFKGHLASAACVFIVPSTLFWTACIHKEGILWLVLGFFFYYLQISLTRGWTPRRLAFCLILFLVAAFFRANMLVTLLPALAIWAFSERRRIVAQRLRVANRFASLHRKRIPVTAISLVAVALIGVLLYVNPSVFSGGLHYLGERQREFQALKGNSRIFLPALTPDFASFWHVLPTALRNGFLEPLPGSGGQAIYQVFSGELILIWVVGLLAFVLALVRAFFPGARSGPPGQPLPVANPAVPASHSSHARGFTICCLIFAFSGMLLIGYTIPFVGTIVRYRSIYLPFLLAPCLYTLRYQPIVIKLTSWLSRFQPDQR